MDKEVENLVFTGKMESVFLVMRQQKRLGVVVAAPAACVVVPVKLHKDLLRLTETEEYKNIYHDFCALWRTYINYERGKKMEELIRTAKYPVSGDSVDGVDFIPPILPLTTEQIKESLPLIENAALEIKNVNVMKDEDVLMIFVTDDDTHPLYIGEEVLSPQKEIHFKSIPIDG